MIPAARSPGKGSSGLVVRFRGSGSIDPSVKRPGLLNRVLGLRE